jgi:hypothetical protein
MKILIKLTASLLSAGLAISSIPIFSSADNNKIYITNTEELAEHINLLQQNKADLEMQHKKLSGQTSSHNAADANETTDKEVLLKSLKAIRIDFFPVAKKKTIPQKNLVHLELQVNHYCA